MPAKAIVPPVKHKAIATNPIAIFRLMICAFILAPQNIDGVRGPLFVVRGNTGQKRTFFSVIHCPHQL
jgi:hypothetical protein